MQLLLYRLIPVGHVEQTLGDPQTVQLVIEHKLHPEIPSKA